MVAEKDAEDAERGKDEIEAEEAEKKDADETDVIDAEIESIMFKAAIVAMIIGVIVAAYLIWVTAQESYSALYIYPESYSNYVNPGDTVTFRYGIASYEIGETKYTVRIYLGNELVKTKEIVLQSGEVWEENESITLPKNLTFPTKVRIEADANGVIYEVHFWLKKKPE
jgi:uncharacterized membrane protein